MEKGKNNNLIKFSYVDVSFNNLGQLLYGK